MGLGAAADLLGMMILFLGSVGSPSTTGGGGGGGGGGTAPLLACCEMPLWEDWGWTLNDCFCWGRGTGIGIEGCETLWLCKIFDSIIWLDWNQTNTHLNKKTKKTCQILFIRGVSINTDMWWWLLRNNWKKRAFKSDKRVSENNSDWETNTVFLRTEASLNRASACMKSSTTLLKIRFHPFKLQNQLNFGANWYCP